MMTFHNISADLDMKDIINQTLMEVLYKLKKSDSNPILTLKSITPDVSPMKQYGSSPMRYFLGFRFYSGKWEGALAFQIGKLSTH